MSQQNGPLSDSAKEEVSSSEHILGRAAAVVSEDNVVLSRDEYNRLTAAAMGVRSESATSSSLVGNVSITELSGLDLKCMQRVANLPLPEGTKWMEGIERRSINRFLNSVCDIQKLAGLDARATFFYLTTRCIDEKYSQEIASSCVSLKETIVNYTAALAEAESYLKTRFARTNRTDKFTDRLESGEWCKSTATFEDYCREFNAVMREGELLDMRYDSMQKRRLFLNGLPAELKLKAAEFVAWQRESSLEMLKDRVSDWLEVQGSNPFAKRKANVRAVETKEGENSGTVAAVGFDGAKDKGGKTFKKLACFSCGGEHFKRDCPIGKPKTSEFEPKETDTKPSEVREHESKGEKKVSWNCAVTVSAASPSRNQSSKIGHVVNLSTAKDDKGHTYSRWAMFDTGADVTMATREFVDELFSQGIVKQSDVKPGDAPELLLADGTPMAQQPLGSVGIKIEGTYVLVIVVESLCCDLIIGNDLIRGDKSNRFLAMLVSALKNASVASASSYVSCVSIQSVNAVDVGTKRIHCEGPPVKFQWVEGAKEKLGCNLKGAIGQSKRIENKLNAGLLASYEEILRTWESEGWLKEIEINDARYFLGHFPVVRDPNGATAMKRCRVVVQGSALTPLLKVPKCTHTDILKNLLLWRLSETFASLDISQAYMRVAVHEEDQKYLCIMWKGRALCFTSLPMGVSPSAQALQSVVDHFIGEWEKAWSHQHTVIKVVPYMDDLMVLLWNSSPGEINLQEIEGETSRNLAEFFTEKGLVIAAEKTIRENGEGSILGVPFMNGKLGVAAGRLRKMEPKDLANASRRQVMSMVAALFDPLGLLAELSVMAHVLLGKMSGLAMDKTLPRPLINEATKWLELVKRGCSQWDFRALKLCPDRKLYMFLDASAVAYGVVVVAMSSDGNYRRLYGKGKIYKKHNKAWVGTSSKIELLAFKAAVEIMVYLKKIFEGVPNWEDAQFVFGTDNETNFQRLSEGSFVTIEDRWQRHTAVEVNNILAKNNCYVCHVPGAINPADCVSRGVYQGSSEVMKSAVLWCTEERSIKPSRFLGDPDCGQEGAGPVWGSRKGSEELVVGSVETVQVISTTYQDKRTLSQRHMEESPDVPRHEWLAKYQREDAGLVKMLDEKLLKTENGVMVVPTRQDLRGTLLNPIAVPEALVPNILQTTHDQAGHLGIRKVVRRLRDEFWWKGLTRDVKKHLKHCEHCQVIKGSREWTSSTGEPGTVSVEGRAWSVVGMDTVKGLDGILLTVTCLYSRYVFAVPISSEKAGSIVKALEQIFGLEGSPSVIVSDNATYFKSKEMSDLLAKWSVTAKFIPRYSPWYGGFYEISHKTLITVLALVCLQNKSSWRQRIQEAVLYYNLRSFEDLLSPHEVFRGRRLINPWRRGPELGEQVEVTDDELRKAQQNILVEHKTVNELFEDVWLQLRSKSMTTMMKRGVKQLEFKSGDYVYVWGLPKSKLDPKWEGPFKVTERLTTTTYLVEGRVEHAFNLKPAYGVSEIEGGRTKRHLEEEVPSQVGVETRASKKLRLASVLRVKPKGDLLWI